MYDDYGWNSVLCVEGPWAPFTGFVKLLQALFRSVLQSFHKVLIEFFFPFPFLCFLTRFFLVFRLDLFCFSYFSPFSLFSFLKKIKFPKLVKKILNILNISWTSFQCCEHFFFQIHPSATSVRTKTLTYLLVSTAAAGFPSPSSATGAADRGRRILGLADGGRMEEHFALVILREGKEILAPIVLCLFNNH